MSIRAKFIWAGLSFAWVLASTGSALADPSVFLCRISNATCSCMDPDPDSGWVVHGVPNNATPYNWDVCLRTDEEISSLGNPCVDGNGDELCGWRIDLRSVDVEIQAFTTDSTTPEIESSLQAPNDLSISWVNTSGYMLADSVHYVGTLQFQALSSAGTLGVAPTSGAVDADLVPPIVSIRPGVLLVPEPSRESMLGMGLLGLLALFRGRKRRTLALLPLSAVLILPTASGAIGAVSRSWELDNRSLGYLDSPAGYRSLEGIGDVNGDGVPDLAIGFPSARGGQGVVVITLMKSDGTVWATHAIGDGIGGLSTPMGANAGFGDTLAFLGDFDGPAGPGTAALAVSAPGDAQLWFLLLAPNSVPGSRVRILSEHRRDVGGSPVASLENVGDVDGDSITDMALGQPGGIADCGVLSCGTATIAFLNADGTLKGSHLLESGVGGMPVLAGGEEFGTSIASVGDLDNDGVPDIAVGSPGHVASNGGLLILTLAATGDVLTSLRLDIDSAGFESFQALGGELGSSLMSLPDLDRNGTLDLAVAAPATSGAVNVSEGAVVLLLLNSHSGIEATAVIDASSSAFPPLTFGPNTEFGRALGMTLAADGVSPQIFVERALDASGIEPNILGMVLSDSDGDAHPDFADNCPNLRNSQQLDIDLDGIGDYCDNCRHTANPAQTDTDLDGEGDLCEPTRLILTDQDQPAAPLWRLDLECGASEITDLVGALIPAGNHAPLTWAGSLSFGGGCDAPVSLSGAGCVANASLGTTVDGVASGAFITDSAGVFPTLPVLKESTLYVQLSGNSGPSANSLCRAAGGRTFLGFISANPAVAGSGEVAYLTLALDDHNSAFGGGAILGIGPVRVPPAQAIDLQVVNVSQAGIVPAERTAEPLVTSSPLQPEGKQSQTDPSTAQPGSTDAPFTVGEGTLFGAPTGGSR